MEQTQAWLRKRFERASIILVRMVIKEKYKAVLFACMDRERTNQLIFATTGHTLTVIRDGNKIRPDDATLGKLNPDCPGLACQQLLELINAIRKKVGKNPLPLDRLEE